MSVLKALLNFSFLCDYASVSREGKLSMNGIFENINVQSFPAQHPSMYVVANMTGVHHKDKVTCSLTREPEPEKPLAVISREVMIEPNRNFGFIGQFVNVRYERPGVYLLSFFIDNKKLGSHSFEIHQVAAAGPSHPAA